ncbi:MAG: histidine kinase [Bacteriovoracaceae bacterium]|nr:histidine kinase [Bacteroidota bacterium]
MRTRKVYVIAGTWFFLGLIYSGQSFFYSLSVGREYIWQRSFFHSFVFCIEWGLLTPFVLWLTDRFRLDDTNIRRNAVIHFVIGISVALVQQTVYVYVTNFVDNGFVLTRSFPDYLPSIVGFFEYGVLMYWSIVFIHHAVGYYRQYQHEQRNATELRSQLAESQLQSLKMQLQPHFLFNTLNAISVLVKKEPALAQKMIVRLSDCLRLTLERGTTNKVTLEQELEFLNAYLAIEKVRFGERLTISMSIEESSLPLFVPTFILQPLAENSIRHGIAQRSGDGWIGINSSVNSNMLTLQVIDGGTRNKRAKNYYDGIGIGLENTQKRLLQLYGTEARFDFRENEKNGHTVIIEIPLKHDES